MLRALVLCAALSLPACGSWRSGPESHEKLVFVVIDALRSDHLGAAGYARDTSPTIDRIAGEGLFLRNLVAHSSQTVPSTLSILSGVLPIDHGVQYDPVAKAFVGGAETGAPVVPAHVPLLAEQLGRAGYTTAAVVANPWLAASSGFARGYDRYHELSVRDGAAINEQARSLLLEHRAEPLFLYLHYMDVHNPYAPRRGPAHFEPSAIGRYVYRNGLVPELSTEDLAFTMALYDERIRYVDGLLAELLAFISGELPEARLTLVITSDHGDEFHEHGGLGHGTTLHAELVNTFAVLWDPTRIAPREVRAAVPAIDLAPTLLDALGVPPLPGAEGRPLPSGATPARPIYSELADRKAVQIGSWKLHWSAESGAERLYRIEANATESGPVEEPQAQSLLRGHLARVMRNARVHEAEVSPLDPEAARQLRALGYLGDEEAAAP